MQTYFLCKLSKYAVPAVVAFGLMVGATPDGGAQTLARPGWAGSGLASEPWWRNAVLYLIVPASFQDSDGDGVGDLRGIANRMDYLQSLGVDAVLLEQPDVTKDSAAAQGSAASGIDAQFEDLISAASQHHVRVVMTLEDGGNSQALPDSTVLALARMWLTRGVAGIFLQSRQSAEAAAPLLRRLRALTDSFPGDRVLLAATTTNPAPSTIHAISVGDPQPTKKTTGGKQPAGAQLIEVPLELANATAKTIRAAMTGVGNAGGQGGYFLSEEMYSTEALLDPAHVAALDGRRRAFALVLLASRGAASLRYGQEIGMLPTLPSKPEETPLMQWTALNGSPVVKAVEAAPVVAKDPNEGFGAYHPYVPPPKLAMPAPKLPQAEPGGAPTKLADLDGLPGFTNGKLPVALAPLDAKAINVAVEDADPNSLLNLYRRLIELHHDNSTLRNGGEMLLDYDDLGAVVWLRQPPKGSTTTSAIIAVCNLSGAPLHLSLNAELTRQHIHTGSLRNLLSTGASASSVQSTDDLSLPPYGVFLGELYH